MSDEDALAEELAGRLASLRTEAPPRFAERVLGHIELRHHGGDVYSSIDAGAGPFFVAHNRSGVSLVAWTWAVEGAPGFERLFRARTGREVRPGPPPARSVVRAFREGRGRRVPVDLRGLTAFQRAVLDKTLEIPRGEVRPYEWVAREVGRPAAVRAVGTALARNPVPVVIPCHRVVQTNGHLGAYVFGTDLKRRLIELEGADVAELERLAASGVRFVGTDTTRVYCLPSCRDARRIGPAHRVTFTSGAAAARAGYRPCHRCRPVPDAGPIAAQREGARG